MKTNKSWIVLIVLAVMGFSTMAHAEWHFGIGTGLFFLNAEGTEGFHSIVLDRAVELDLDMDPDDFSDVTDTAFGLGGYATDGTWLIKYSIGVLKLEDSASTTLSNPPATIIAKLDYDITAGEVIVGYPVLSNDSFTLRAEGGVRYIRHDINLGVTANSTFRNRNIDESWTDFLVGLSLAVPLAEKWSWDSQVNAGFGGSDGTYGAQTGVTWQFYKRWSTTLYGNYTAIEYENSSKGQSDWYLYDVDEYGVGLSVLYNW